MSFAHHVPEAVRTAATFASDSVMVAGARDRAIGCMALCEPETGRPGVRVVLSCPAEDQGREIHLAPEQAMRLGRAIVAAAEATRDAYTAHEARELGIMQSPPKPLVYPAGEE